MCIEHELDPELRLRNRSTQMVLPQAALWLDQANMENKSDSPSRTIRLMIREARDLTEGLDPDNNIFTHAGVKCRILSPTQEKPTSKDSRSSLQHCCDGYH